LYVIGICAAALIVSVFSEPLPAQSGPPPKIGFAIEAMKGERWQTDLESFEARAKQLGAEVISSDAKGDDDLQYRQVKEMINSGIRVLVLLPHDTAKAARTVDAAKAAHVKVVSYDRLAQDSNVDLYVSFNRAEIGRMQANYLATHAGKGNFVLIGGSPLDEGAKALHDAQIRVLQPYIDRGDVKVIADTYTKDWLPSEAYISMLNVIDSSSGVITAVVAANDVERHVGGARNSECTGRQEQSGDNCDPVPRCHDAPHWARLPRRSRRP